MFHRIYKAVARGLDEWDAWHKRKLREAERQRKEAEWLQRLEERAAKTKLEIEADKLKIERRDALTGHTGPRPRVESEFSIDPTHFSSMRQARTDFFRDLGHNGFPRFIDARARVPLDPARELRRIPVEVRPEVCPGGLRLPQTVPLHLKTPIPVKARLHAPQPSHLCPLRGKGCTEDILPRLNPFSWPRPAGSVTGYDVQLAQLRWHWATDPLFQLSVYTIAAATSLAVLLKVIEVAGPFVVAGVTAIGKFFFGGGDGD